MGKRGKIAVVIVIGVLLVAFFLGIYVTVREKIPENAVVVVTLEDKHYHSIHFDYDAVAGKTAKTMTLAEAERKGFNPHPQSIDLGYFRGNRLFLYQYVLSKIGIHYNSRWDRNGNWLW
ncbi:MAG: hypothetical protein ACOC6B_01580 [Thermodesulfobacteriota bacterium]